QSSGLSEAEIKKMQEDAAAHADEDKKKRELVEQRNRADSLAYQVEKTLKENADKISDNDKAPIEAAIAKVRDKAKGDDPAAIKSAVSELEAASHAMSAAMYSKASADGSNVDDQTAGATAGGKDDDVMDAEFEVKES